MGNIVYICTPFRSGKVNLAGFNLEDFYTFNLSRIARERRRKVHRYEIRNKSTISLYARIAFALPS